MRKCREGTGGRADDPGLLGIDPGGDELAETPARYVKALRGMTAGYGMDPAEILSKTFPVEGSGLVVCRGIRFTGSEAVTNEAQHPQTYRVSS